MFFRFSSLFHFSLLLYIFFFAMRALPRFDSSRAFFVCFSLIFLQKQTKIYSRGPRRKNKIRQKEINKKKHFKASPPNPHLRAQAAPPLSSPPSPAPKSP